MFQLPSHGNNIRFDVIGRRVYCLCRGTLLQWTENY